MAIVVGLGFIAVAFLDSQYRYLWICLAIVAFLYGYRTLGRHDTPFQRRERELKRKQF